MHQAVTSEGWAMQLARERIKAGRAERRAPAEQARADVGVGELTAPVALAAPCPMPALVQPEAFEDDGQAPILMEELTREQVIDWRARAQKDHQLVVEHVEEYGEAFARRLCTSRFLDQVLRLIGTSHLVLGHTIWGRHERREVWRPPRH
jgi:hypothetical protein